MRIADNVGKVAVQRGPIVYALEGVDNGGSVLDVALGGAPLTTSSGPSSWAASRSSRGPARKDAGQAPITFVPYYAWNNRGVGEMAVWMKPAADREPAQANAAGRGSKSMAITFDDLPKSNGIEDSKERAGRPRPSCACSRLTGAGVAFVNEGKLYTGAQMVPDRAALLQSWVDAGIPLANHTYSHLDINNVSLEKYQDDVVRGERTYTRLQRGAGSTERWFRHPSRIPGRRPRSRRGSIVSFGPGLPRRAVHDENSDWIFSAVYAKAMKAGDEPLAARVREAYLAYSEAMLDWCETLAKEDFGRDIPQILLIHSNDLHTDTLDALLTKIEQRGYRWATLGDAMKDPARRDAGRVTYGELRAVMAASLAGGEEAAAADDRRARPAAMGSSTRRSSRSCTKINSSWCLCVFVLPLSRRRR